MSRRWTSRRAVLIHLTALVVVPACAVLCVWQVSRALSGNTLSWAYVFEWPIFGAYAVYVWWRLIHEGPDDPVPRRRAAESRSTEAETAEDVDELAAYNRYLSDLNASGRRKQW